MPQLKHFFQQLKNIFFHLPKSIFFNLYYHFPAKNLILLGVTGTDGKTTTCTLLHHLLTKAGFKTEIISTINAPGLHTTSPDSSIIQKLFQQYAKTGVTHVICEVTSHALDQHRFWGCRFRLAILTNVSHEHLDYHQSLKNYIRAKSKLFTQSDVAILNADDQSFPVIKKDLKTPCLTYSIKVPSDFRAKNIVLTNKYLKFKVNHLLIKTDSHYHYQTYNILSALAAISNLGLDPKLLVDNVINFPLTAGRRQEIKNPYKLKTIIDFAHTPKALQETLSSLRKIIPNHRLIVIFGATGGRDKTKRPLMGRVVSRLADIAIVTADDTRQEKVEDINQQIISGFSHHHKNFTYHNIPNRQDAFNLAIKLAKPGDIVIACGKGHETTILHGSTEYPWSEVQAFRSAFRNKNTR